MKTLTGLMALYFFAACGALGQSIQSANATFAWVSTAAGASGNIPDFSFDTNGNCYVVGHFNSTNATIAGVTMTNFNSSYDSFVTKYNPRGQAQWVQHLTGDASDIALGVAVAPTNWIYITGAFYSDVMTLGPFSVTNSTTTANSDIFVAKLDLNGNVQWLRSFGGNDTDTSFHTVADHDGNVLILGSFYSANITFDSFTLANHGLPPLADIFLVKLDSAGNVLWARNPGGTKSDVGYRMTLDAANNIFVTGYFNGTATFDSTSLTAVGSDDLFVAKYNSSGAVQWAVGGGGTGVDEGFGIALDASGNSYVTGYFSSSTATFGSQVIHKVGGNDMFVVKVSPSGTFLWARSAGGTGDDRGRDVAVDTQGSVYVSGIFSTTATFGTNVLTSVGGLDMFLTKYDPSGNLQWVVPFTGLSDDQANEIEFDGHGHLYISGQGSTNTFFGTLTVTNALNSVPFIGRLDFLPPNLSIARSNNRPILSWATNSLTPTIAQSSTNVGNAGSWHDLTNTSVISGGASTITNLAPTNPTFFRLRNVN